MSELKRVIAHPSFKNDSIDNTVTARIMQDLQTTHSALLAASVKKGHSIVSVLEALTSAASSMSSLSGMPAQLAALQQEVARLKGAAAPVAAAPGREGTPGSGSGRE